MAGNGNSGRRPDKVRLRFEKILSESGADVRFREILRNTKDEATFLKAYDMAHDRAFGKAAQYVEMDLNDITGRPTREELEEAIRSLRDNPEGTGVDQAE
jgi:hypothetical protein